MGSISGNVSDDQGNPLSGVTIELQAPDSTVIDTTTTDGSGNYIFADVEPGDYNVVETNPAGFPGNISDQDSTPDGDAADSDTTVDNVVGVTLNPGENDTGNDFVDNNNGSISGNVSDDQGNPLSNVTIELQAPDGTVIDTTTTDGSGNYIFADVEPGDYNVVETNPAGFPGNISDQDSTPDGDAADSDTTVDNVVGVTLNPGENDTGNDFVDNNNGSISGNVSDDQGNPLSGVTIELQAPDGTVIDTTTTDGSGNYIFADVEPGDYNVVETNPAGFPGKYQRPRQHPRR